MGLYPQNPCRMTEVTLHMGLYPQIAAQVLKVMSLQTDPPRQLGAEGADRL